MILLSLTRSLWSSEKKNTNTMVYTTFCLVPVLASCVFFILLFHIASVSLGRFWPLYCCWWCVLRLNLRWIYFISVFSVNSSLGFNGLFLLLLLHHFLFAPLLCLCGAFPRFGSKIETAQIERQTPWQRWLRWRAHGVIVTPRYHSPLCVANVCMGTIECYDDCC